MFRIGISWPKPYVTSALSGAGITLVGHKKLGASVRTYMYQAGHPGKIDTDLDPSGIKHTVLARVYCDKPECSGCFCYKTLCGRETHKEWQGHLTSYKGYVKKDTENTNLKTVKLINNDANYSGQKKPQFIVWYNTENKERKDPLWVTNVPATDFTHEPENLKALLNYANLTVPDSVIPVPDSVIPEK